MIEITEEQKYRARVISLLGFAFMTPLGHFIVDPGSFFGKFNVFIIWGYFIFSLVLVFIGLVLLEIGRDILYKRR